MTGPVTDWRDQLFEQRSYFQLIRAVLWTSWGSRSALSAILMFLIISGGGFAIDEYGFGGEWSRSAIGVTFLRTWAVNGLAFGSAMLAFLIAGFTVFATVTDVRVFRALALMKAKQQKSQLQTIFLGFMADFWNFIVFIFICVCVGFFFGEKTPWTMALGWLVHGRPLLREALVHVTAGALGSYLLLLVITTKSFTWNVYQSILLAIAVKAENIIENP